MPVQPTLLVGLGTSGMWVINEVEKLIYSNHGTNTLPHVRSLYIETDTLKSPDKLPVDSAVMRRTIEVNSLENAVRRLHDDSDLDLDWFSDALPAQMSYNSQGAGGVRPAGRILLWTPPNFTQVYNALSNAWASLNTGRTTGMGDSVATGQEGQIPCVYVVGTLFGGTCSGTFIDIGYILQKLTMPGELGISRATKVPIIGIFLLPTENTPDAEMGCGNSYGALLELENFRQHGHGFAEKWPNGVYCQPTRQKPFDQVYLIAPEYGDGSGQMDLRTCYSVAGMKLYADILGMSAEIGALTLNAKNAGDYTFFATFGISAVMYPRYALSEAAACELGKKLCDRWLAENTIKDPSGNDAEGIIPETIFDGVRQFLDDKIQEAFRELESSGDQLPLQTRVEKDLNRVLHEGGDIDVFTRQFLVGDPNNYCGGLKDRTHQIYQRLCLSIGEKVRATMKEKQNLRYTELLLLKIQESIAGLLRYWDNQEVPTANSWNDRVSKAVKRMFSGTYWAFGERPNVVRDRAEEIVKWAKMMVMRDVLKDVSTGINSQEIDRSEVPTLRQVGDFRKGLRSLQESFAARASDIKYQVTDPTVPVLRVWASGRFTREDGSSEDGDLERAVIGYLRSRPNNYPSFADAFPESPWDVFARNIKVMRAAGGDEQVQTGILFEHAKREYQARCKDLLAGKVDPVEYACKNPADAARQARRALAGLLHLQKDPRAGAPGIPRFVIGSDVGAIRELIRVLQSSPAVTVKEFGDNHAFKLPDLGDAVFFYEEKSNIEPLTGLSAIQTLKNGFENLPPAKKNVAMMTSQIWKQHRLAYGVSDQNLARRRRRTLAQQMMQFVLEFGLKYAKDPFILKWKPTGVRWPGLDVHIGDPCTFTYTDDNGLIVTRELDPNRAACVKELAEDAIAFPKMKQQINLLLEGNDDAALANLFNTEIRQRITEQESAQQANEFTNRYFGEREGEGRRPAILASLRTELANPEAPNA